MPPLTIRAPATSDTAAVLALADRLPDFGPTTRTVAEIVARERQALADALSGKTPDAPLLVAEHPALGVVGVMLLESRRDYFTGASHGHVSILAVAREAQGQGVGRALLDAAEAWGRGQGFAKLTLAVFTANTRAKDVYTRLGWRPELETFYKELP